MTGWEVDRAAAGEAVAAAAARVQSLMRSVENPSAKGLGRWNVAELAVHLSTSLDGIRAMAQGGGGFLPELGGLSRLTEALVAGEEERDLARMADRVGATVEALLAVVLEAPADELCPWAVQGTRFRLSQLLCQALCELLVHGRDLALAGKQPLRSGLAGRWPIGRSDARMTLLGFVFPAMAALGPAMVNPGPARDVRATYDVHVRGGGRAALRFADGDLTVTPEPLPGPVDCRLSVDPAAFLLVSWGRVNQWQAILRGKLLAYGRKPWIGLELRSLLTNP